MFACVFSGNNAGVAALQWPAAVLTASLRSVKLEPNFCHRLVTVAVGFLKLAFWYSRRKYACGKNVIAQNVLKSPEKAYFKISFWIKI